MSQEVFYICSAIGILLTFLASITAVVVSLVSMRDSKQIAMQTNYQNIISVGRAKWQVDLRKASAIYLTQIERLCTGQDLMVDGIVNDLVHSHFTISLLIFKQDKELFDEMTKVREKALMINKDQNIILREYAEVQKTPKYQFQNLRVRT